jgi:hypothetical protein
MPMVEDCLRDDLPGGARCTGPEKAPAKGQGGGATIKLRGTRRRIVARLDDGVHQYMDGGMD